MVEKVGGRSGLSSTLAPWIYLERCVLAYCGCFGHDYVVANEGFMRTGFLKLGSGSISSAVAVCYGVGLLPSRLAVLSCPLL